MSNEQAVQILIPMRNMMCDQNGCPISDAVFALDKAIETLSAPSIDIVRCKECKHKQQCRKAVEHITHDPTSVTIGYKTVEWCSYGERKGE